MQGHPISGRYDPSRERVLGVSYLHALGFGAVERRPFRGGRKDVVREHVDVLPTRPQERPPHLRWNHRRAQLGAGLLPAERDRVEISPWTEWDASAREDCRVGVQFANSIDCLSRSGGDPHRLDLSEEAVEVRLMEITEWSVREVVGVPRGEPLQALELGTDRLHMGGRCSQIDHLPAQHGMHRVEKCHCEFASTKVPLTDERVEQQHRGMAARSRVPPQGAEVPAILISEEGDGEVMFEVSI